LLHCASSLTFFTVFFTGHRGTNRNAGGNPAKARATIHIHIYIHTFVATPAIHIDIDISISPPRAATIHIHVYINFLSPRMNCSMNCQ
jgi:hypothetical protein